MYHINFYFISVIFQGIISKFFLFIQKKLFNFSFIWIDTNDFEWYKNINHTLLCTPALLLF